MQHGQSDRVPSECQRFKLSSTEEKQKSQKLKQKNPRPHKPKQEQPVVDTKYRDDLLKLLQVAGKSMGCKDNIYNVQNFCTLFRRKNSRLFENPCIKQLISKLEPHELDKDGQTHPDWVLIKQMLDQLT